MDNKYDIYVIDNNMRYLNNGKHYEMDIKLFCH